MVCFYTRCFRSPSIRLNYTWMCIFNPIFKHKTYFSESCSLLNHTPWNSFCNSTHSSISLLTVFCPSVWMLPSLLGSSQREVFCLLPIALRLKAKRGRGKAVVWSMTPPVWERGFWWPQTREGSESPSSLPGSSALRSTAGSGGSGEGLEVQDSGGTSCFLESVRTQQL